MRKLRPFQRAAIVAAIGLGTSLWSACSDSASDNLTGPSASLQVGRPDGQDVQAAIAAQERHTGALLRIPGVVGTAVGLLPTARRG